MAVSLIVSRAELDLIRENDQGTQLLNALRETCLVIVESTWLHQGRQPSSRADAGCLPWTLCQGPG